MANTFFTIGHSTRTIVEFADLLQESGVNLVVDVRSIPRSRTNPQFNQQGLPEALAPWQIGSGLLSDDVKSQLAWAAKRTLAQIDASGWEAVFGEAENKEKAEKVQLLHRAASVAVAPARPWLPKA